MLRWALHGRFEDAALGAFGNNAYQVLIAVALVVGGAMAYRRLVEMGADRVRARGIALFCVLTSYPLGILSSQAVKMFYLPREQWSFARWVAETTSRGTHTYHAALLLPLGLPVG